MVDVEEGKLEGFHEITVDVGQGKGRRQRFLGVLLVEWERTSRQRTEQFHVYRSRTGKFVVHCERSEEYMHRGGSDGNATGVRKYFSQDQSWGTTAAVTALEVYADLGTASRAG